MSAGLGSRALESNLQRLRRRAPALAAAVGDADLGDLEVVAGPKGQCSVRERGLLLGSAYDPRAEGQRLAREMETEQADLLVAVGFGLGHHLQAFRELRPCPTIVYEPNPARLQAALRATPDLVWLGDPDVAVVADPEELRQAVARRYEPGMRIQLYPHPALLRLDPGAVKEAVERVSRVKQAADVGALTRHVKMLDWADGTIENAPHLLAHPSTSLLRGAFRGSAAVVCAAGPSLTRQLPTLAALRDRALVIAIGQSLGALCRAGIEPDLVHIVESQDVAHQLRGVEGSTEIDLVLPPQAHAGLFAHPVRRRWIAFQETNPFGRWVGEQIGLQSFLPTGGTVAQCAVFLARELGCDPVILIGQDLAFDGDRVYAEGTAYAEVGIRMDSRGRCQYTNLDGKLEAFGQQPPEQPIEIDLQWVEGWDGKPVATSRAYAGFLDHYRDLGLCFRREGRDLVNCTEGGARIHGLRHARFREVLEGCAPLSHDPRSTLAAVFERFDPTPPGALLVPIGALRRTLQELGRDCELGLVRAERARKALAERAAPARQRELLRRLGRVHARVGRRLASAAILDALVQRELREERVAAGRAAITQPGPQAVVAEIEGLLRATKAALEPAARRVDVLEARLGDSPS